MQQIAIELPDELANTLDIKAVSKELLEYVLNKYAPKPIQSTVTNQSSIETLLKDIPFIESLRGKDPLVLQQEMRNDWH